MSFLAFLVSFIVLALKSSFKNLKLAAVIVHLLDWQFSVKKSKYSTTLPLGTQRISADFRYFAKYEYQTLDIPTNPL